LVVNGEIYK